LAILAQACGGDEAGGRNSEAGASRAREARGSLRCDDPNASLVVDSIGIGPVIRGARVAELASRCPVTDTTIVLAEGSPERASAVVFRNHTLVVLTTGTPDTSIIRVVTSDPAFKTSGGVGVGSSVQALRLAHGRICAARGESDFVVMASDLPGVSFAIDWSPPPSRDPSSTDTPFPGGDPGTALDAARITRLWVHGVAGGCRVRVS
jgi:hypothetical protein